MDGFLSRIPIGLPLTQLVQKIQRRLVRVIVSVVNKISYDKRYPKPKEPAPTICDSLLASPHNIEVQGNLFRCVACCSAVSRGSANLKKILKSLCSALPYDDSQGLVPIPAWHLVQIGNTVPHSSHQLHSIRGIVCCDSCGAFAAKKCRLLAAACTGHCSVFSQRALDKLKSGQLPVSGMRWPRRPKGVFKPASPMCVSVSNTEVPHLPPDFDDPEALLWEYELP